MEAVATGDNGILLPSRELYPVGENSSITSDVSREDDEHVSQVVQSTSEMSKK